MMNASSPSSLHGMALQQVQRPQRGLAVFGGRTEAHEGTGEWGRDVRGGLYGQTSEARIKSLNLLLKQERSAFYAFRKCFLF